MSNGMVRASVLVPLALAAALPAAAQQTVKLPNRDVALRERPADVYSVGTVEGRDWEMFSQVRGIAFDRADNMYVLDGQNLRVLVFNARGGFVRQFGRRGGGPGEFQAPLALDLAADGNIVVSDLGNRAFIIFTPEGEHLRNVPFNEQLGFPINFSADATGGIIARVMPRMRRDQPAVDGPNFTTIYRQPLAEGSSTPPHALYQVPVPPPRVVESGGGSNRVMSVNMDPVFGARTTFGALPDGLAVHHETAYNIQVLDAHGRALRSITRDFQPRRVTKKDQEAWQERRRENERTGTGATIAVMTTNSPAGSSTAVSGGGRGGPPSSIALDLDNVPFAEFMSVVSSIRTDSHGRIWVQRRHEDGTNEGPIDLVTAEGRYIGTLPPQALPRAVSASGLAAWVETDELGVEKIAVRRLPAAWK